MNSKVKSENSRKPPGFRKNLRNYSIDFTRNTGIHGLKHLGEQDRTVIEKVYWMFLFCISLVFCTSLILKAWTRWEQSPVSEISVQSSVPLWKIPFPAITICPEIKIKQRQYNYTKNYYKVRNYLIRKGNITQEKLKKFYDISLICTGFINTLGNKTTNLETIDYLMKLAPPLSEIFKVCNFKNLYMLTCDDLFKPTLSEDGICYTFNMLDRSEIFSTAVDFNENYTAHGRISSGWTFENGYPKNASKNTFPERAIFMGSNPGMTLELQAHEDDFDYLCRPRLCSGIQGEKSTPICGPGSFSCLYKRDAELFSKEVEIGISNSEQTRNKNLSLNCDCLPSCTSVTCNTEVSQTDFDLPKIFQATGENYSAYSKNRWSFLLFSFKDTEFISSRKEKLYEIFDLTDFIAACGEILGLFTGFSFLSIIEIFYFSSLRLICNIRKYGKHYWSGIENEN